MARAAVVITSSRSGLLLGGLHRDSAVTPRVPRLSGAPSRRIVDPLRFLHTRRNSKVRRFDKCINIHHRSRFNATQGEARSMGRTTGVSCADSPIRLCTSWVGMVRFYPTLVCSSSVSLPNIFVIARSRSKRYARQTGVVRTGSVCEPLHYTTIPYRRYRTSDGGATPQ